MEETLLSISCASILSYPREITEQPLGNSSAEVPNAESLLLHSLQANLSEGHHTTFLTQTKLTEGERGTARDRESARSMGQG